MCTHKQNTICPVTLDDKWKNHGDAFAPSTEGKEWQKEVWAMAILR